MRLLHIGLCANGHPYSGLPEALSQVSDYAEIPTSHPNLNEYAAQFASDFKPDLVFCQIQSANVLHPETIQKIKETGAFVVNWSGDIREEIHSWFYEFGADLTLFSNMPDVKKFRLSGKKSDFLQIGIDPKIFTPEGAVLEEVPEIVFLGTNYGANCFPLSQYRIDIVHALHQHFGKRFGVYGSGWGDIESGNVNGSQVTEAALYRGCKVAINCSHFDADLYFSDRMIRLMGSGAFCLSHNYTGIEKDWEVGSEVVTFDNIEGLISKCEYYLKNTQERNTIAALGCHKTHQKFTYKSMVENLIKLYHEYRDTK